MREQVEKITGLLDKYLKEELSPEEKSELDQWVMEDERNGLLFQQVTDKKKLAGKLKTYSQADSAALWQTTLQKINEGGKVVAIPVIPAKKAWVKLAVVKYAAAAAIVGVVSLAAWKLISKPGNPTNSNTTATVPVKEDEVKPGTFKAILTLADGNEVTLNKETTSIPSQGATEVKVTKEGLVYISEMRKEGNGGKVLFNTVTTLNGGEYQLTLPDGSKVRLNAASSLRFPIAFAGNERHVQLTGEAYFEVEKANEIPFIVSVNNGTDKECDVQVLGTHFNVMAYTDEPGTQTTLLEGLVKIKRANGSKTIKPGQQANVSNKQITVKKVNTDIVTAWKEGRFAYEGDYNDMSVLMRQIARWYDIEVKYQGSNTPINRQFEGGFPRDAKISSVIQVFKTNGLDMRLEGRKLIITQ